ncbi:MAG: hypothetical protein GSR85_05315 [Desulfurococcales archaeon]|nr:hypothetical protein [Desulfurococcales archaeon]
MEYDSNRGVKWMSHGNTRLGSIIEGYFRRDTIVIIARVLLWIYLLELLLNRLLFRILIFIPQNQIVDIMATLTTYGGRFALNLTVLMGLLVVAVTYNRIFYSIPILVLVALDSVGLVKLYWGLLLVALLVAIIDRRRIIEALFIASLVLASITPHPYIQYLSNALWILAPLPYITKNRLYALKWSLPISLLLLIAIVGNAYIMGQIFILGMGIITPWLLPPAIVLYSLSKPSMGRYSLLLTGPRLQLSNQVIVIAALYIADIIAIKASSTNRNGG